jgi:hypothetical protein
LVCVGTGPTRAAGNLIERLATCQDSWMDWKDNPTQMKAVADAVTTAFTRKADGAAWAAKGPVTVIGLPVSEAYPQSVGMGVGFSLTVDATFDTTREHLEKAVSRSLTHCETSDGMKTCDLELAPKRTLMLMAEASAKSKATLLGCYYLYEK